MQKTLNDFDGNTSYYAQENVNGPIGPRNIAKEGAYWELLGGKYICKFGECKKSFVTKWLFHRHVDKDKFLIMPIGRFGHLSTMKRDLEMSRPYCHEFSHLGVIFVNAISEMEPRLWTMLKKIATKVDRLQIEAQCVPEVCKPILVRLADSIVHKILGMEAWGVGLLASTIVFILEKFDDLVVFIINNMMVYAKEVCMTWDPKCEKHGPSKARQKKRNANNCIVTKFAILLLLIIFKSFGLVIFAKINLELHMWDL